MFCPSCGQSNPDEAKFCGKCGAVVSAATAPKAPHVVSEPVKDTGVISQGMKTGMIIGSIVLPLLGIIMGVIYLMDPNPEKKQAGKLWLIIGIIAAVVWSAMVGA
ncbi:MAG TPA: zinc ribbon domain-containing protein [Steroidobacteraceae bacterium]|nr:zinc ribbon domain-containing protein [Steroidobacteraceae bacterium]